MIWSPAERRAWAPKRRLSVSQWAEEERLIVSKDAAEPGKWHNARAPYLVGIMDALSDPAVEEVNVMKPARVGGSEIGRNFLGRTVAQDPGPFLIVFPDENLAKKQLANEIVPLLESAPLKEYLTESLRDLSKEQLELQAMRIYPAWAGSPATLAEKTIRYVWLSEVDKYPPFSGREADPMSLAKRRTQTYGYRRKIYAESTPTTRMGAIARAWEAAPAKYRFHVPCSRCGSFQVLTWAQVKWAKHEGLGRRELAALIEATGAAWYECIECHGRIDENEKAALEDLGEWRLEPACASGPIRAYHISGLLSMLGMTWARMVGQFLRAIEARSEGDVGPLMDFITQSLGEWFEDQVGGIKDSTFEAKRAKGHKPKVVPKWAGMLIATADTQRDGFWYVVRAWGRGERSRLIDRGRAGTFAELDAALRPARYPIEGWNAEHLGIRFLALDAGGGGDVNSDTSLTDEVYRFCLRSGGWAVPLKGWGGMGTPKAPVSPSKVTYTPPGGKRSPYDVVVNMVDTQYFKGVLAGLISTEAAEGAEERWELCDDVDAEYVSHMTAERKVAIRKGGGIVERWERQGNRPNHFFDAEVYQLAAARMIKADVMPAGDRLEAERAAVVQRRSVPPPAPRFTTPDGRPFLANRR
ncbi:MAG TPA: terminase gpA endonuclease subunit [Terriglobales bacterium]|nr:terminase gpA endonuclease subunit [Terriglobales bacterium]